MGRNRFPSENWLLALANFKKHAGSELALSCHLCGSWVREILVGKHNFLHELTPEVWSIFDRVQINTHAEVHEYSDNGIAKLNLFPDKQFIFQIDNVNTHLLAMAKEAEVNYAGLFDLSHGIGKLPENWPDLITGVECGYAGGLGPENLKEQIERIEEKAGNTTIWIDMETRVRSNNDRQFDLSKVIQCLEIAKPYIQI